jgi:preprotein translocase subunit YajC
MIPFIIIFIVAMFVVLHFIELAVERKYEIRNQEMLNNIKKLDEKARKK